MGAKPLGLHAGKGQRVVLRLPVAKGTAGLAAFGLGKAVVDRVHQRAGGAEIGLQRIVPPGGGPARLQVAGNVGAAKAINRLLGVANQQQGAGRVVLRHAVNLVKDLVLQRRGVLKLVNQRHRVLLHQALAQALGVGALQGCVQARQQVGKAKVAAQALALQHPRAHPGRRVQAQRHAYLG